MIEGNKIRVRDDSDRILLSVILPDESVYQSDEVKQEIEAVLTKVMRLVSGTVAAPPLWYLLNELITDDAGVLLTALGDLRGDG